ncbi:hypothetical protein DEGR_25260 [Deinococcus grandis]|nr:hypothetical protein DEGR_25260 [Deinococcus grandis]
MRQGWVTGVRREPAAPLAEHAGQGDAQAAVLRGEAQQARQVQRRGAGAVRVAQGQPLVQQGAAQVREVPRGAGRGFRARVGGGWGDGGRGGRVGLPSGGRGEGQQRGAGPAGCLPGRRG